MAHHNVTVTGGESPPVPSPRRSYGELVATILWSISNVLLALALSVVLIALSLNVGVCGPGHPCNFGMNFVSQAMMPVTAAVALVGSVVLAIVFRRTGRPLWLASASMCALVIVAFVVAVILNSVAVA